MSDDTARDRVAPVARRHLEHDLLLAALPHPILAIGEDECVVYANPAAEGFFSISIAVLRRQRLRDVVGFGCPLIALIDQVRRSDSTVNEYGIEIAMPRVDGPRLVDVYAGPLTDHNQHGSALLVLPCAGTSPRERSSMAELQLPKLVVRVRFPSLALM